MSFISFFSCFNIASEKAFNRFKEILAIRYFYLAPSQLFEFLK